MSITIHNIHTYMNVHLRIIDVRLILLKLEKISLSKIEVIETVQSDNRLQPQFKQTL